LRVHIFVEIDDQAQLYQALGPPRWIILVRCLSSYDALLGLIAEEKHCTAAQADGHLKSSDSRSDQARSRSTRIYAHARWTKERAGTRRGIRTRWHSSGTHEVSQIWPCMAKSARRSDSTRNLIFIGDRLSFSPPVKMSSIDALRNDQRSDVSYEKLSESVLED